MSPRQIESRLFIKAEHALGEGPFWFEDRLWWVDIEAGNLHSTDAHAAGQWRHSFNQRVTAAAPMAGNCLLVSLENGVGIFDRQSGHVNLIAAPDGDVPGNRCNDGKCDPRGRFVVGTLNMNGRSGQCALYSINTKAQLTKLFAPASLSNGLAWSEDGRTLYFVDSTTYEIAAFDYDLETGLLGERRVVIKIPREMGLPDGMDIDVDGNLWVGHWGGFAVRCWSPLSGECLAEIKVPCLQPTSCCFGGPRRDQLFITTARMGMAAEDLRKYPHSGSLFVCESGTMGFSPNPFIFESYQGVRNNRNGDV